MLAAYTFSGLVDLMNVCSRARSPRECAVRGRSLTPNQLRNLSAGLVVERFRLTLNILLSFAPDAAVPRDLWDRAHAILQVSPPTRAAQNRLHAPSLLKGLLVRNGGRAMSPTHAVKNGRRHCYCVAQRVLKTVVAARPAVSAITVL